MNSIRHLLIKPGLYIVIVIFGTLLKFYNLDSKLFWGDEVSTVIYTIGVNEKMLFDKIPVNQIKSISYYDSLLHPGRELHTLSSEIKSILSDTHLTPAHYVFLTIWHRLAGNKDIDYRLFSAFIFIISLPFIFLLSKTLFNSNLAGWLATSLYAVSPFIHFEAQEARYYILWVFFLFHLTIFSCKQ